MSCDAPLAKAIRVMLVSTHNLGSVLEFCDRTVLLNRTVLAYGPPSRYLMTIGFIAAFAVTIRKTLRVETREAT